MTARSFFLLLSRLSIAVLVWCLTEPAQAIASSHTRYIPFHRYTTCKYRYPILFIGGEEKENQKSVPIVEAGRFRCDKASSYDPLALYGRCLSIVVAWVLVGTLFYSYCNSWPLSQSFFYAIDAGMSIGFCTDVEETKLASKAFTIVYILLGASFVGGALAVFLQDILEDLRAPTVRRDELWLEKKDLQNAGIRRKAQKVLSSDEFRLLLHTTAPKLSEDEVEMLWKRFDRFKGGILHFREFANTVVQISVDTTLHSIRMSRQHTLLQRVWTKIRLFFRQAWGLEYRIYVVFCLWMAVGITWGMLHQHWDFITATHFAVSALATGGLTAPQVNADGILPSHPSLFCGFFCLFGIPLFALTLAHFARALVSDHMDALERSALAQPMSQADFEVAANLTTSDSEVHLSDFIVMQLFRQGKITKEQIEFLKNTFDALDVSKSGTLTLEEATLTHDLEGNAEARSNHKVL